MKEFKMIVAGGRDFSDRDLLAREIVKAADSLGNNTGLSIVSGLAKGADLLGLQFAKANGVVYYEFPANWEIHGKAAGFIRNQQMSEFSDGLLAFWDGVSPGTRHMIQTMKALNKPVTVVRY
jgi:hypothetical protein